MLIEARLSTLVIVDVQGRLMPAMHDAQQVLAQNIRLARIARLLDVPVIGTEQNRAGLGPNVAAIAELCEQTLHKTHFNACADGLARLLPPGRRSVVVTGCEAHVCMLQTAAGLLKLGYDVFIAIDAVGSRQAGERDAGLARLASLGAQLVTVEMLAFEWLADYRHPRFREVLALIK